MMNELHEDGFATHRGAMLKFLTPGTVEQLKRCAKFSKPIFNYDLYRGESDDNKRRQVLVRRGVCDTFTSALRSKLCRWYPTLNICELRILYSKAGCQRQNPHCDYEHPERLSALDNDDVPLFCVVAFVDGTTLDIWPRSMDMPADAEITRKTVKIEPGDVLVVRGDVVHAGSAYAEDNWRLHCYLDSPHVARRTNRTWLMHDDDRILVD